MRIIASFWNNSARVFAAVCLLLFSSTYAGAEEIQVVKSGKYYGEITGYSIENQVYLGAKEAARVYGGQVYWYAVRAEVRLSVRGKQMQFQKDSKTVNIQGKSIALVRPMIVRAGQAFIPVEFFTSSVFSDAVGVDTKFNPKTRLLLVDQRSNVGPLRWFSYADHTRVVLELSDSLKYQAAKRGLLGYEISIPSGQIDWSEKTDVKDGVLEFLHLYQDERQAHLSLKMQPGSEGMRVREFKNPRRIVIDIARQAEASQAREDARISSEVPEAPAKRPVQEENAPVAKEEISEPKAEEAQVPAVNIARDAEIPKQRLYRIAIDAGHGGRDGGAVGRRGILEKDINLKAAKELAQLLEQEGLYDVMLTRDSNSFVRLGERARRANNYGADLFISLHCNAHTSRKESGFEIYFLSERASDPEAERLAEFENSVLALEEEEEVEAGAASVLYALARTEFINDAAELAGRMTQSLAQRVDIPNRGVKQAAFYVLRGANAPAVLVEMGFLSNARDEAKLESEKYRRKIVEGLYAGIVEFIRTSEHGGRKNNEP